MPGNICGHTHFYGAYARGMAIPGSAPKDFPEILEKLWWPLDKSLTEVDVYYSAMVMLIDAIKNGTTTLIDHHASPNAIDGSLDQIAKAVEMTGLRAVLCYEVTDRDGLNKAQAGIDENVRFLKKINQGESAGGRINGTFGLHASLTLSDRTLEMCKEAVPEGTGFHIHVAEHEADEYDSLQKSGFRVVDRLLNFGILGPNSIVAHGVHIDSKEISLLSETGTRVTHQPRSNMNNGVGVADVESMMRSGVNVCIGTDGFSHTMWEEWKTAYLLHKVWNRDPRRMSAVDVIQMGVYNSASLANLFFPDAQLGEIKPGAFADLIFVDYRPHTPLSVENLPWQIIFGFQESMVTTTIVSGVILMRDRKLVNLDEEMIISEACELAPAVWERYNRQFNY
jgi:putative selenium metabolism protein SsnA